VSFLRFVRSAYNTPLLPHVAVAPPLERGMEIVPILKRRPVCDSPLERGVGVCHLRFINTPLHPHFPARPLSRGELFIGKTNLPNSYDVFTAPLIICFLHYIEHIIKLE
jgi:hypothetical protein